MFVGTTKLCRRPGCGLLCQRSEGLVEVTQKRAPVEQWRAVVGPQLVMRLEVIPQCKLHYSCVPSTLDFAKKRRTPICIWVPKVGPIHQVESLGPKRNPSLLARHGDNLLESKVVGEETWTNNRVPPRIAERPLSGS